ncbi:MAG: LytTR family DNA-binding domain-containing protein, partial [Variovorax sp.]
DAEPAPAADAPPPPAEPAPPPAPARPERFLVRKLRREFLIAASDIDWLQAEGNYVGLHVNGHDYLLRATLTDFLTQLDPALFVRVHRSHAVNLSRLREIEPLDGGDARLHMHDGSTVPCSRRYREALRGATAA